MYKAQDLKSEEIVAMKKVRIALTEDGVPMSVLRLAFFAFLSCGMQRHIVFLIIDIIEKVHR